MHTNMTRWIALTGALAMVLASGAAGSRSSLAGSTGAMTAVRPLHSSSSVIEGAIVIKARYASAARGRFVSSGAIADSGTFTASRRVVGGRLQLTETFVGKEGTIRVRVARRCRATSGTWLVLSGATAYAGLTGGGTVRGVPRCVSPGYPIVATHTGTVRTPPPPELAKPGKFGGETAERREVTFEVVEGGRAFTRLRMFVSTPCEGTPLTTGVPVALSGPFDIAPDTTFSIQLPSYQAGSVTGRFTSPTTAEGTLEARTTITSSVDNTTRQCKGSTTWKASLPPPAATPGQYCGFTNQGSSVCVDVGSTGRIVTSIDVGIIVLCNRRTTEVELRLVFRDMPIGGNLGFSASSSSFEGLISGTVSVSGLLDPNGGTGAHGSVRAQLPVFDYEGSRYTCGVASTLWEARRQ